MSYLSPSYSTFQSTFPRRERPTYKANGRYVKKFQSTFPRRERLSSDSSICAIYMFQSTFPRRERPRSPQHPDGIACFNPRSREGNDSFRLRKRRRAWSFNPRSREGNDSARKSTPTRIFCFNPRSREGNDRLGFCQVKQDTVSIHVPAKGTTRPPSTA